MRPNPKLFLFPKCVCTTYMLIRIMIIYRLNDKRGSKIWVKKKKKNHSMVYDFIEENK